MLGGRITSGSLLGELIVLREESIDGIPLKTKPVREVAAFLSKKKQVYPACNMAFTFLQTTPVTVASNERSFSKLKLVKTKLRSTMLQDRLESLMLISCERDVAEKLDVEKIIRNWINLKKGVSGSKRTDGRVIANKLLLTIILTLKQHFVYISNQQLQINAFVAFQSALKFVVKVEM